MILIKLTDISTRNPIYINIEQIGYISSQTVDRETITIVGIVGSTTEFSVVEKPTDIVTMIISIKKQIRNNNIPESLIRE